MKRYQHILIGILLSFTIQISNAQDANDEIVFKAIGDEMTRSLTDLKLRNFNPPFFIASYVVDGKSFSAQATLGALVRSKESPLRNNSNRLMVGSYELNDENFRASSQSYNSGGTTLSLPKYNDYAALRRCFWVMNDRMYKNAIDGYTQKLTALKQQNNEESEKIDDYIKLTPVTSIMKPLSVSYDKAKWENNIKELSAIFRKYPQIQSSAVNVYIFTPTVYMLNSEGSKIKSTSSLACITITANTQAQDGELLRDQHVYYAPQPEQLPSMEKIKQDINEMAGTLEKRYSTPVIDESFQGPVVFEGEALAELFSSRLFGDNGLLTFREPIYAVGVRRNVGNWMENKMGKRICSENISIVSNPRQKEFGNIPLAGSFEIDAEGVVPANGLVLVDKGILKTQLSDRIPTPKVKESNGHSRFGLWGGRMKAPGVIQVNYDKGQSYAEFLKTVATETERNGLEYYYIIRRVEISNITQSAMPGNSGLTKPIAIYKVSVKTGEEKLVRNAVVSEFPMLSFKYVIAGTSEQVVHNTLYRYSIPVSYIVPKAIAFNDVSIEKDNTPKSKLPIVETPLAGLK
jgi:hypothetical protein